MDQGDVKIDLEWNIMLYLYYTNIILNIKILKYIMYWLNFPVIIANVGRISFDPSC